MDNGDFLKFLEFDPDFSEVAAECGLRPFIIMAGALDGKSVESKLLSYQGPFGVGYAVASFTVLGEEPGRHFDEIYLKNQTEKVNAIKEKEGPYVRLARQTLEN